MLKAVPSITGTIQTQKLVIKGDTQEVKKLLDSVKKYYNLQQLKIAQNYIDLMRTTSGKIDYKEGLAIAERWLGRMCADKGQISSAIEHTKNGLEIYTGINNNAGIIKMNNILGDYHYQRSDFNTALQYYIEALKISETIKDNKSIAISHNNLGLIYTSQGKFEKALYHYMESIRIKKSLKNNEFHLALTYNNVGRAYLKRKYYDSASYYADLAYKVNVQPNDSDKIGDYYLFKGNISYEKGEYQNAEKLHHKALGIFEKNKNIQRSLHCKIGLAKDYIGLKKNKVAENLLLDVVNVATTLKTKGFLMEAYLNLSTIHSNVNEYGKALSYYKLYSQTKDSIFNEETRNNIIEINSKYESDKKNRAIEVLSKENAKKEAENLKNKAIRNSIVVTIILITVLIILAISIYNFKRHRKRQKEFALKLIGSLEAEQMKLSRELHDSVGQELLFLKMQNQGLNMELIEGIIQQVRGISRELHPVKFQSGTLKNYLISLIENLNKSSTIYFTYEIDDVNIEKLSEKINIYRILQEAINNIIKHSSAENARVTLVNGNKGILISLRDDGRGFDVRAKTNTLGMITMKERASLIDAEIKIESGSTGTLIELRIKHG